MYRIYIYFIYLHVFLFSLCYFYHNCIKIGANTMANIGSIDLAGLFLHLVNIGIIVLIVAALVLVIITCTRVILFLNKKEKKDQRP
jgi:hypothetical protein